MFFLLIGLIKNYNLNKNIVFLFNSFIGSTALFISSTGPNFDEAVQNNYRVCKGKPGQCAKWIIPFFWNFCDCTIKIKHSKQNEEYFFNFLIPSVPFSSFLSLTTFLHSLFFFPPPFLLPPSPSPHHHKHIRSLNSKIQI